MGYQQELASVILESLKEFHLPVRGKTVLLKPNLVGLDPLGTMNTHPAVIAATRESFLRLGASEVFIGEARRWIVIPRPFLSPRENEGIRGSRSGLFEIKSR